MFEEVATESIAGARNVFTYEEIEGLRWSRDSGSASMIHSKQPFSDGLGVENK